MNPSLFDPVMDCLRDDAEFATPPTTIPTLGSRSNPSLDSRLPSISPPHDGCSATLNPTCVHLPDKRRNGPVQILAVDHCIDPPDDRLAQPFRCNHERHLGLRRVQLLEEMVVMARQPEEASDPFPTVVRVELGHGPGDL